jgi:hypothetical protein
MTSATDPTGLAGLIRRARIRQLERLLQKAKANKAVATTQIDILKMMLKELR